jgi:polyribonucleotide nucleotidyltransferase
VIKISREIGGKELSIETGRMAKQANGSVLVQCGDTVVFVSACAAKDAVEGRDFFPLTVDYREKSYAAGRFPGGFFKRESRPSEHEILTMRLIDRPIRPMFHKDYCNEVQIMAVVLSADGENAPDVLAMIGASAALSISDIPFAESLGSVRVGLVDDEFVLIPTHSQMKESKLDLLMSGTEDAVMMVEGGAELITEEKLLEALKFGHEALAELVSMQKELVEKCGKEKIVFAPKEIDSELVDAVKSKLTPKFEAAFDIADKKEREKFVSSAKDELLAEYADSDDEKILTNIKKIAYDLEKEIVRRLMLDTGKRTDGRSFTDIRPITCEVEVLPRTHGSALFTRGQTQALVAVTLGTVENEQRVDSLEGSGSKSFMLHYNFPPFSVGECRPVRGVGRREIGHGNLAERSLEVVKPDVQDFPYTIRIVSEIMESNGSSSMASVCGGSLALMDAGVPIKHIVSGIAMGLIKEGDKIAVLSDILGLEDHLGDMDFKVTGTADAITAFQMDIKIKGISFEIMEQALKQAKEGRLHILGKMKDVISSHKEELSEYAPKVEIIELPKDKIGDVIGAGGKVIKGIIERTGVKINIDDEGRAVIMSEDLDALNQAKDIVVGIITDPEVGKIYEGKVVKVLEFGAFVEFMPGKDGLVHISKLDVDRVEKVADVVAEGDIIKVKLEEIDKMGRYNLSRKAALLEE